MSPRSLPESSCSTIQGAEVSPAEIPRPEYPRPQFVRARWLNLNGEWEFRIDDHNAGLKERWFSSNAEFPQRILVPFSFESPKSGIGDRSFHSCVWHHRRFGVLEEWGARRILLNFGAVDYRATVWVNGIVVCSHEGGHTPFNCDITITPQQGEDQVLVVRAEDPPADRYIPRGKQYWREEPASIFYARTTGLWQTVWLEPVPLSYLESVRITARIDGAVSFGATIADSAPFQYVTIAIEGGGRTLASSMSLVDGLRAVIAAQVGDPKLWSPEEPHLYTVRFEPYGAEGFIDGVESYFGFRSISAQEGKVLLNGNPVFLKTVLDQGYWPESNLTPPTDEAIQADTRVTKELGFNGIRKHRKVEDPRYLYWRDKMALLVSGKMANAYLFDVETVRRITQEWIEVIKRDYHHPRIIIWVPVNESWGVPNLVDQRQQAHVRSRYYLTKSLDDTRLVIDNDGWEQVEVSADDALERMRGLYKAIARIQRIAGICYTQLYDVEQEVNRLLTYDRKLKFDSAEIRAINQLLVYVR